MPYTPRDIDTLIQEMNLALINQNSPLSDISEGSVISSILRAVASTHQKQELSTLEVADSYFLTTSSGADLNLKAGDVGLQRKSGSVSSGSVLSISQEGSLYVSNSILLTDPVSGIQIKIVNGANTTITTDTETRLQVQSVAEGERSNLPAGTRLITPLLPSATFVVGSHRTTTGVLCGDMTGGRNPESNAELRQRIRNTTINNRGTTEEALRNTLLQDPSVSWVSVLSSRGIAQAWVDSPDILSSSDKNRLLQTLEIVKPAGILIALNQATRELVDINVLIKPTKSVNLQSLTDQVIGLIKTYLQELQLGKPFVREEITNQVFRLNGVVEASVLKPTVDYDPADYSVIRAKEIRVSYDTV